MECPGCRAKVSGTEVVCPHCGTLLPSAVAGCAEGGGIVEGTAERGPVSAELPLLDEGEQGVAGTGASGEGDTRIAVRREGLPAVLWQQPAVRVAVQAGAGAIALTLGMRLLRAWLARPRAVGKVATSVLPTFGELLQTRNVAGNEVTRPDRGGEVVETVILMRRVVRRR